MNDLQKMREETGLSMETCRLILKGQMLHGRIDQAKNLNDLKQILRILVDGKYPKLENQARMPNG